MKQPPHASKKTADLGNIIRNALSSILRRCEETGVRLGYPGEGGERAFRGWLVSDLLITALGWPTDKVVVGERFDVLLQDADGFPVATIETKEPYHKASKKERADFEERLSGFGTLRHAYFTNGNQWERLDIFSPTGDLEIQTRFSFDLNHVTPEESEAFLRRWRVIGTSTEPPDRRGIASVRTIRTSSRHWPPICIRPSGILHFCCKRCCRAFAMPKRDHKPAKSQ